MKIESIQNEGIACVCHGYGQKFIGNNNAGWEVWTCPSCKSWAVYGVPEEIGESLQQ